MPAILKKYASSDLAWAIGAALASVYIAFLIFGTRLYGGNLDLHFHDTYFVVPTWGVALCLFLLVLFLLFYYKSAKPEWQTFQSFVIVLCSGTSLILLLTAIIAFSNAFLGGGWTIYPPLSGLGNDEFAQSKPGFLFAPLSVLMLTCQLPILLMLLRTAIRFGAFRAAEREHNH